MPRNVPLLILACAYWVTSDFGIAFAQPAPLPDCNRALAEQAVAGGNVPTLVGCTGDEVGDLVARMRERFRVLEKADDAATGIKQGRITRQELNDGVVTYFFSTGKGYPPPPPRPRFSIDAPASVPEGGELRLTIRRADNDGQPHRITLYPKPPELLKSQPAPFDFSPDKTDETVTIDTAEGQPGDGDREIAISLVTDESADAGDPQSAVITIIDRQPTSYEITPPQDMFRGEVLTFLVRRVGPPSPARLDYQFHQGQRLISPDGLPHPLIFGEGDSSNSLRLTSDYYDRCGPPPTLMFRDEAGREMAATASFSDICQSDGGGIRDWLDKNAPWWPIPAGLLAIGAITYGIRKIFFPPVPNLYPTWDVEAGPDAGPFNPPRIPGWPRFSAQVDLEWGGASVPEPLPIAETNNG